MNRSTARWIGETIQCRQCYRRVNQAEVGRDLLCIPCHQLAQLFPTGESNRRRRGHDFLTASMLKTIPALYATERTPLDEKTLHAHYFFGDHDWYLAELDPDTGRAFGYSTGGSCEWGYMDLFEMEATVGAWNIIERDLHFTPQTTQELGIA